MPSFAHNASRMAPSSKSIVSHVVVVVVVRVSNDLLVNLLSFDAKKASYPMLMMTLVIADMTMA